VHVVLFNHRRWKMMFGKGTSSGKVLCYILLVGERGLRQRIAEGKGARLDLQTATKPIHLDDLSLQSIVI